MTLRSLDNSEQTLMGDILRLYDSFRTLFSAIIATSS